MYRDLMNSVQAVTQKRRLLPDDQQDRDLVAMARGGDEAVVQCFLSVEARLLAGNTIILQV